MRPGRGRRWNGLTDRARPRPRPATLPVAALLALALAASACTSEFVDPAPEGSPEPSPTVLTGPQPTPDTAPSPEAEPFRLSVKKVDRVLLNDLPRPRVRRTMKGAIAAVRLTLTRLHRLSFLSHDALQGRFGEAVAMFSREARGAVRRRLGALTLGPDAPGRVAEVRGGGGWIRITVLLGRQGGPVTAEASTFFHARAVGPDGEVVVLESLGSWFLRPGPETWTITGFSVRRKDHPAR